MRSGSLLLHMNVEESGEAASGLEDAIQRLSTSLRELPIDSINRASGGLMPARAKGLDPLLAGTLLVQLTPLVLSPLVDFLKSWVQSRQGRSVTVTKQAGDKKIELKIDGAVSTSAVERFIQAASNLSA